MKTSNKITNLIISTFIFLTFFASFGTTLVFADNSVKGNLATGFSFSDIVKEAAKTFTISDDSATTSSDVQAATSTDDTSLIDDTPDENKNVCEHFDSTVINILNLETASADTRQKIENVEATIDDESVLRNTIFESIKDFLGLQQSDKKVFAQMKQDITDAKNYYDKIDLKTADTEIFLDQNYCENTKLEVAKKMDTDTQTLVVEESVFRKALVASLKDKMKILQDSVKSAKK